MTQPDYPRHWFREIIVSLVSGVLVGLIVPFVLYVVKKPILVYRVDERPIYHFSEVNGEVRQTEEATYVVRISNFGLHEVEDVSIAIRIPFSKIEDSIRISDFHNVHNFRMIDNDYFSFDCKYINSLDHLTVTVQVGEQYRVPKGKEVVVTAKAKGTTAITEATFRLLMIVDLLAAGAAVLLVGSCFFVRRAAKQTAE